MGEERVKAFFDAGAQAMPLYYPYKKISQWLEQEREGINYGTNKEKD